MGDRAYLRVSIATLVVIGALVPLVLWSTERTLSSTNNKPALWVSEEFEQRRDFDQFVEDFETHTQIVISWDGCTVDDERLAALERRLESAEVTSAGLPYNEIFTEVFTGYTALRELMQEPLDLPRQAALARLYQTLVGPMGKVHLFSLEAVPPGILSELDGEAAPPALLDQIAAKGIGLRDGARVAVVNPGREWVLYDGIRTLVLRNQDESLGVFGKASCAVIGVTRAGDKLRERTVNIILETAQQEVGLPPGDLHLAGDIVDGVAIDAENNRSNSLALPSALISLVVCWLCLRSFRLTGAILIVSAFGGGLVLGLVSVFGLTMNAVFSVMAPLVFVLTVSAGVHLTNYFFEQLKEGREGAVTRALQAGWAPCTLAAVTTAIGLGSLLVSDVLPVRQFGMISSLGVLITTGLLFLVMPGAMVSRGRSKGVPDVALRISRGRFWGWLTQAVAIAPTVLALLGILAIVGTGWGIRWIQTSVSVRDLLVADSRTLRDYHWLEDRIGPLVPIEIIVHFDGDCDWDLLRRVELLRDIEEVLRGSEQTPGEAASETAEKPDRNNLESLGGVTSVATFTPLIPPPGRLRNMARRTLIRNRLEQQLASFVEAHLVNVATSRISVPRAQLDDMSERLDASQLPDELRWRIAQQHVDLGQQVEVMPLTPGKEWRVQGEGAGFILRRQRDDTSPQEELRVYRTDGRQSWRVSTRAPAMGDVDYGVLLQAVRKRVDPILEEAWEEWQKDQRRSNALAQAAEILPTGAERQGFSATYTGLTPLVYTAQRALLNDLIVSFLTALVLVTLVMIAVQRSLLAGLLAMAPNVFPSAVLFGAMGWLGLLVDIGTVMTASVALGIAVDGTLHYLTWFRRERREGRGPREAVERTYRHCGVAMTQTTLICGLGLLVFATSGFLPTRKFALMMVALLLAALVGDLVLLPALLLSPLGRLKPLSR